MKRKNKIEKKKRDIKCSVGEKNGTKVKEI